MLQRNKSQSSFVIQIEFLWSIIKILFDGAIKILQVYKVKLFYFKQRNFKVEYLVVISLYYISFISV